MFDLTYHEELISELLTEAHFLDNGKNTSHIQRIEYLANALKEHGREKVAPKEEINNELLYENSTIIEGIF